MGRLRTGSFRIDERAEQNFSKRSHSSHVFHLATFQNLPSARPIIFKGFWDVSSRSGLVVEVNYHAIRDTRGRTTIADRDILVRCPP